MHARWLALPLAALTGCATASAPSPRLLPPDLRLGSLSERTAFEDPAVESSTTGSRDAPDDRARDEGPRDTPKKRRRRKVLFFLGAGAAGFGGLGVVGFGIGGRVVQGQLDRGYDEQTLTRSEEDTLTTTGEVMNGLAIGSAVIGLAGVILAATAYGIDHARCGDLPPRRKRCPDRQAEATESPRDSSSR